ncbi:unnamed protein product [Danaus chrysippus]|uniref:(African queen) hypothetical protein n=1 Tax=Danaus chrysippus TaxID=151541 RepID=A0A8J2QN72_9NEOP|nr:unnamed protein product [Danaus chrysippus]
MSPVFCNAMECGVTSKSNKRDNPFAAGGRVEGHELKTPDKCPAGMDYGSHGLHSEKRRGIQKVLDEYPNPMK